MSKLIPFAAPENYKRATETIRRLWDKGETRYLPHALERMRKRKIDVGDVRHVIKYGAIIEHSCPHGNWRYRIDGRSVDGKRLAVVVEIAGRLVIVTVIDRQK